MSRRRFPWNRLGIDETGDTAAIRKAYADALRATNVDEDIAGYAELRRARDQALWLAAQGQRAGEAEGDLGLGELDDDWDAGGDTDGWRDSPEADHPDPTAPVPDPEQIEAQQRAKAAWNRLLELLYPDGAPSDAAVTHAELDEGLAALAVLTDRAAAADLAEHDALDGALAQLFASTWPRSAPFVEPANAAFHWLDEAGVLEERPALRFLNQRLKGMRFHEKVQRSDHPLHRAWAELSRPGKATLFDRLRIKRLEIDKLLTGVRQRFPELETLLDPVRVASWEGDKPGEGAGGTGPRIVRGIVIVLLVVALPRLVSTCTDPGTRAADGPLALLAPSGPSAAEVDRQVADIFGPGLGMVGLRVADPVFADQLRLAFNRDEALAFVRRKALGTAEIADYDNLAVRADLRGIWMAAALQQSPEACRKVMAGNFVGLDLALGDRQRDRERALLRQLLEAGLLRHMPEGGALQYSVPGWLVGDTLTRSGLNERKLIAALTDPDSPDRCTAETALIEAALASERPVPQEVLKGL